MMTIALAAALFAAAQEAPEDLVRKLGEDTLEGREAAAEKLLRIGEPAREALTKALASDNAELKIRADKLLKTLDIQKEIRAWLSPAIRFTMSGLRTLKEAITELERRSGHKFEGGPWSDVPLPLELKDETFWDALEHVCAASGTCTPEATSTGIRLTGTKYVRKPRADRGGLTIRVDSVEHGREFEFEKRTEKRQLAIRLTLGWERSVEPVWSFVDIEKATDDQGFDLKPGFEAFTRSRTAGGTFSAEDPPAKFAEHFHLVTYDPPKEKARSIPELKGKIVIWVKASPEYLSIPCPEAAVDEQEHPADTISVFDERLLPAGKVTVTLIEMGSNCATLKIEGVDLRMLQKHTQLAYMTDKAGKRYPTWVDFERDPKEEVFLSFTDMPKDAQPNRITLRIPKRVVKVEIPFSLKDIPVN